jgi:hypothetical protein
MSTEMVGREATLERGGRSGVGVSVEGVDEWARSRFERLGRWGGREGKKEGGGGGLAAGVPRGVGQRRGAWLGLAGGVLALTWAGPGGSKSGEARVVRGHVWASPRRKWGQPSPDEQYGFAFI